MTEALALGMLFVVLAGLALRRAFWSFAAQKPADYAGGPDFDLRRHLAGPMICDGVLFGPTGRVATRFRARMQGIWQGDAGRLLEEFRYDSGNSQNREWVLQLGPDGTVRATAGDLVGEGRGQVAGAALQMRYRIRLMPEAGGHVLDVVDWMYLGEDGVIVNRSEFRKFGIKVAELVATIRPVAAAQAETLARPRDMAVVPPMSGAA